MSAQVDRWVDDEAGPVVRPYAVTRGRTRPAGRSFDLVAMVRTARRVEHAPGRLSPEELQVLGRCQQPTSVAELATLLHLPVGVIGVLIGDLRERGLVHISQPVPEYRLSNPQLLRRVADGLRRL